MPATKQPRKRATAAASEPKPIASKPTASKRSSSRSTSANAGSPAPVPVQLAPPVQVEGPVPPLSDEIPVAPAHRPVSTPMIAAEPKRREPDAPTQVNRPTSSAAHRDRMRDAFYELTYVRTDLKPSS